MGFYFHKIVFFCALLTWQNLKAQSVEIIKKEIQIVFSAQIYNRPLVLSDSVFYTPDSLCINQFKFYISGFKLLKNNKEVYSNSDGYYLINFENLKPEIRFAIAENIEFDAVQFNLGIDSLTNTSGALSGSLDPTLGMYWTWQNGYINSKIEGKSLRCNTRNHAFTYHLGGYQYPYCNMQQIELPCRNNSPILIGLNLDAFFSHIDLENQNTIMSPGQSAVDFARLLANTFYIK